ncbi:MAG: amino acid adenylation domain-containing protein, partial [Gemmataceae bacterium]|nr:amino acid adenylation domain-containing protein [Gemmataceae bacterium]
LHIGGGCLADGYLNRPELTAEKFIPDPFAASSPPLPPSPLVGEGGRGGEGAARLYRTGDLARYFPDGNLEFLGRLDFQVKIRGFRIELGEIETVLAQHPAVREGLVTALKDESGDRYLCGYVIARPGQQPTGAALREFLAAKLPAHMVPAHYVTLEAFPLNPNGKIDRKALPAPGRERRDEAAAYVAPRDPTEQAVAAIWAEVLGVERVGIHDDFFAMGGHSLTATRAVSRIRQQLRIDLPLPVFFQAPTVAKLCAGLPKGEAAGAVIQPADLPPGPDGKVRAPASFGQRRLWFLDQLGQDREVYNIVYQIRMTGPVDEPALRRALETLVERHATLRTTFADEGGQPVQVIAPPAPIELELLDLTALPPGERDADAAEVAAEEGRFVFDLAQGPLWRARLVRLAAEDHLLLWTMHHIVSDGWSMWVLVRELAAAYEALLANRPPTLPPLPLRYADFSQWQCGWLQGAVLEGQLGYWTKRLAGSLPVLQLPVSRTRPKTQTFRGAVHRFALPLDLAKALEEVSRHEGVTPYMALLAAFVGLLHRYSGQEDILVGTPIANRNRAETEGIVGLFINTLVLRTDVSGDLTLRELLARIRQGSLEAFAHQDLPFDLLVQAVKAERSASHQPLFQVLFNYLHGVTQDLTVGGGRWLAEQGHNGTAKFDLTLQMEETQQGLRGLFEYNTDLFDAPTVERLTGHFQVLLRGLLADLDRRLSQVLLLTDAERRQLLVQWNATRADYPRDRCTHQLVEEQAARTPDRVAVVFDNRQLTYGELNARANQLAHHLKTLGVGPETLVGLCVERSTDMVVGLLGILKAGGAYVPLDPDFPRDRLAFYLQDSAMPVLVTQRRLVTRLAGHRARTVCLDADAAALAAQRRDNLPATATPANLAYVIYTSGSTGKPKGVQVPQGALVNFLNAMRRRPGLTEQDTLLAVTTLSFDIHALEVWLPLTVGAKVVVVSKDVAGDGVRLLERMTECAATVLQATPATWRLLLEAGWQGTRRLKALCGGEPMTVELAEKLLGRVEELWNMYGPTETTVWSTVHRVTSAGGPVPIGRPIDNTQIYLVDAHHNPVPVGVVGELLLGGDGVARGYLNRPELTAEKFVPDPFVAPAPPCPPPPRGGRGGTPRVYRTGDLARYLPDGNLECLGRVDHQVKVRGFRIELGEIETILGQHPAVQGNVVVARKDDAGADYLAAYVIPRPGQDATPDDLRRHLHAKLPDYMVPSYFVILEQFPLTPNGKIDRKALPAPQQGLASAGQAARAAVAPRDDAERELAQIWEDVLKVRPVGVTDNFFDLGGHSFLAAVLIARIRQQMGHALPLGMLFEAPTVEKLAAAMRQRLEAGTESSLVPLHEDGANPPLYMIAGVGGHVFTFHRFARLLGPDQPVYGVKAIGIDGTVAPPETVEAIAAHYVKEILAVRPKGPYLPSGYSVGAVVAFELALQLRALGHEVPGVVVFDMLAPGYPPKAALPKRLWMHFSTFLGLPMRAKKSYLGERLDKIWVRLLNWTGQGLRNAPEIQGVEGLQQGALKRVWLALSTAVNRYRPAQKFDGKVVLFKAEEGFHWAATIIDDPLYGWGQLTAGGVETHTVPGGHMEIFHDKNIDLVARGLMESVGALQKGR